MKKWEQALTPMRKAKVIDHNGFSVCTLSVGTKEDIANAKLIAAAPELLEALIELQNAAIDTNISASVQNKAVFAIAKALGI